MQNTPSQETLLRSANLLKTTVPLMSNLGIPITPENYAVWYEYSIGGTLTLNKEIDARLSRGEPFTSQINHELYLSFVANRCTEVLEATQEETWRVIQALLDKIKCMSTGADKFSHVLENCQGTLSSKPDISIISDLVTGLIEETRDIKKTNKDMAQSLTTMNKVIDSLRSDMKSLSSVAMTDQLTGIANRRAFDKTIREMIDQFVENRQPFSLLMIDIDHFKQFNDTYGHAIGDKVLVYVAGALKDGVKGDDVVARYGGEEFAIFLPETDYAGAMAVGEHVRKKIAQKRLTLSARQKSLGKITISVGVAVAHAQDDEFLLMERADKGLYQAKRNGRNQVVGECELVAESV